MTSAPSLGVTGGTAGTLSGAAADLYNFKPSNPTAEATALNILTGGATSFSTGVQTDAGGVDQLTFSTTAQWIALKLGAGTFFLKNTGGPVTLLIDYVKASGKAGAGGGFSHYTEFGNVVPVPAAIWLMGAGIAGLGFAGRRRKTA
ncbi:MAG: VPLPA-CTERM sorting domain-containing protein [Parvularculaceae bacterium]